MKFYYILWVDSITRFKKHNPARKDWKLAIFILNTWINALNFWIILLWLKYFNISALPPLDIDIFPGEMIDEFLSFTIRFALIFGVLNYFLIFHKNRYNIILEKYPKPKKNIVFIYSTVVVIGALASGILYGILT